VRPLGRDRERRAVPAARVENLEVLESSNVHYWASPLEAKLCAGQEVVVVGAGNSAGQAVVYLAGQVAKVCLLVRGADLNANMSSYLVDRITGLANVEVFPLAEGLPPNR
jgi:thioredoxin reductase (NADPH)